jgi:hypothetical protein
MKAYIAKLHAAQEDRDIWNCLPDSYEDWKVLWPIVLWDAYDLGDYGDDDIWPVLVEQVRSLLPSNEYPLSKLDPAIDINSAG